MEKFMVSDLRLVSMETTNQTESFKLTNEKSCQREHRFFYSSWKKFSTSSFLPVGKTPTHSQENQQMVLWRRLVMGKEHVQSKWAQKLFHGIDRGKSDISVILDRPSQFFWGLIVSCHFNSHQMKITESSSNANLRSRRTAFSVKFLPLLRSLCMG